MSCFGWIVGGITISLAGIVCFPPRQYLRQGILTFDVLWNLVLVIGNATTIRSRANKVVYVSIGVTFNSLHSSNTSYSTQTLNNTIYIHIFLGKRHLYC